jgi:oxygen-independent coproporphyrinogen III oxidase
MNATLSSFAAPDLGLVRKYAVAGPRYTSYPPATRFTVNEAALDLTAALAADNANPDRPLSLYVHLPFCESRCWYCGCTTVITRDHDRADPYLDYVEKELALYARHLDPRRPVTQLHFGGGTPTFLAPGQLRRLGAMLRQRFRFTPDAEISVEIDPRRLSLAHIEALRDIGATRASLGVQDTNSEVQLAIHRHQPHALNEQSFAWLRGAGFTSINVDLIYGLPLQSPATIRRTIEEVLALGPDRLSVFSYAHVPWLKQAQQIFDQRGQLPDAEQKLAMFATAHRALTEAGYVDIGLDHFARPDDELARARAAGTLQRNFQGYSTRAGASLHGFGMSSISSTPDVYFQNHKTLAEYRAALDAGRLPVERGLRLTDEDKRRRTVIMRVMCERRLDFATLSREFGFDFPAAYARELESLRDLVADGIVERTAEGIAVTPAGAPLLRIVAMRFDPASYGATKQHSQTV